MKCYLLTRLNYDPKGNLDPRLQKSEKKKQSMDGKTKRILESTKDRKETRSHSDTVNNDRSGSKSRIDVYLKLG